MTREKCDSHILFVGFMGAGKTSVSRRMSSITGMSLIDVDYRIEAIQHRKISQIFADEGEAGFRRIEAETLAGIAYERRSIVSCGGGIVYSPKNRLVLKSLGTVIYLDVPLEEGIARISHPETRPLLSDMRRVEEIYRQRLAWYEEVADITVRSSNMSVHRVAQACVRELEERGLL